MFGALRKGDHAARRVAQATRMVLLVVAVGLVVALSLQPGPPVGEQPTSKPYVEQLAERFDCWGNDGGHHPFPTRVIYRRGGDWQIGGKRVVDQALDQIFNGTDHGLEVYKFCVPALPLRYLGTTSNHADGQNFTEGNTSMTDHAAAPYCPEWCTQHDHDRSSHLAWLDAQYLPLAPETLVYGLYVSEGLNDDGSSFFGAPSIGMQVRDTIPLGLSPEQARHLAAALIRAAEIVEERLVDACEDCGTPIAPDRGRCPACTVSRTSFRVLDGGRTS